MADSTKSDPRQGRKPRMARTGRQATQATPLDPYPWIPEESRQEARSKAAAPPVIPPCLGGVWWHEGQKELANNSWYQKQLARNREEDRKVYADNSRRVAAILKRDAAQEAAAPPVNGQPQEAAAGLQTCLNFTGMPEPDPPQKHVYTKSDPRFHTSTYIKPRRSKWKPQSKAEERKAQKTYDALAPTSEQPDTWVAEYPPKGRRQMHAREVYVRAMGRETRLQQNAIDRSTFFCNRLIEDRIPLVEFSEMRVLPIREFHLESFDRYDRTHRGEDNDETT